MSRTGLVLLAAVSLGFAPAPFLARKPNAAADLKALQGEWVLHTYLLDGKPAAVGGDSDREIHKGDRIICFAAGKEVSRWRFVIDPSKSPRVMLFVGEAGTEYAGIVLRSIYRVEGDKLTLCWNVGLRGYPDDLKPGKGVVFKVFNRNKP